MAAVNPHNGQMVDNRRSQFEPPPHENAETHARIMARLEKMSRADFLAVDVKAGIRTESGQLTATYVAEEPPKR